MANKKQPQKSKEQAEEPALSKAEIEKILDVHVDDRKIGVWFFPKKLDVEQQHRAERIRLAAAAFAQTIKDNTDGSADQTAAIRKIREASMTAVQCVATRGL